MATISMTNLNDAPSGGKLTETDFQRIPRQREVSVPGLLFLAALAACAAGFGWLALAALL